MEHKTSIYTFIAGISVNFLSLGTGFVYGWSSPMLPKLNGQVDPEYNPLPSPATLEQQTWMTSLSSLGALCGPFLTAYISEEIGRKKTLLLFALPCIAAHVIIVFASSVEEFYVARLLMGLTVGCVYTVVPLYAAEISENHNRGLINLLMFFLYAIGHFAAVAIGPYVTVQHFSVYSLVPLVSFLIVFGFFSPETPYYFMLRNKPEEAEKSLKLLRGGGNIEKELKEIHEQVEHTKDMGLFRSCNSLFTSKHSIKALTWSLLLMSFQQLSGYIYVASYTQTIFDLAHISFPNEIAVILVFFIQIIFVLAAFLVIDRLPRRLLAVLSLSTTMILALSMGTYFYLLQRNVDLQAVSWLPMVLFVFYVASYNIGIGPIAYIIPGEIFDPHVKSIGITLVTVLAFGWQFFSTVLLPNFAEKYGNETPFWVFSASAFVSVFFIYGCLPETKGKSFLEIQSFLRAKTN
ncbi:facilitated trehalose transporter Tret1-like [Cylas formicarius]|uniref:facilitated trehalose transporter Tret1-like n=1 Tax=Cylas formicarius TaxID=197179 RepID=UPI00295894DA|nr:facilitated trehalose transporter Tret1-like [Cylas formicarius]